MANERKYIDPDVLALHAKYRQQGLTTTSNNTSIIPRDTAGNIQYHENATNNALLIIEPVATKIITKSVLKVIDTQFQYFKFPATTRVVPGVANINLDLASDLPDPVYARYKPSENRKIAESTLFSGILIDEVVEGQPQTNINSYYITKEVKESGADLRFRAKINHRYDTPTSATGGSIVEFSIIKQGPDTELNRQFKGPYLPVGNRGEDGIIEPWEVLDTEIEVIITNNEFNIGDYFGVGARCDQNREFIYSTINSEQTYWVITDASKNVDLWNREIA
jgi:hypothetical protein